MQMNTAWSWFNSNLDWVSFGAALPMPVIGIFIAATFARMARNLAYKKSYFNNTSEAVVAYAPKPHFRR